MEVITLWYRNKTDRAKQYTFKQIADGFFESQFYADYKAERNYPHIQRALVAYMTDKEGLNSSYDDSLLDNLLGYVLDNREGK